MRDIRDREWLTALFDRHHRRVLAYAVRRVGRDAAEDVTFDRLRGRRS